MRRAVLVALAALIVFASVGIAFRTGVGPIPDPEVCSVTVQGHTVVLDHEQAENASLIAAIAMQRGLPPRAVSIALATAYQESKIYNIEHGDRDSLGLFQQRPSQGWGTEAQILDPHYSTHTFYDALVKVDGYQTMPITEAAQEVQRSAFPDAYADHEQDARALASALTGETTGGVFSCVVRADVDEAPDRLDDSGLTPRAAKVRADLEKAFGSLSLGGFQPGGLTDGHMDGSTHYEGRAIDVFVRPISRENKERGWAIASYLVAHADALEIQTVIFDDRIWRRGSRSEDGWEDYRVPSSSRGDRNILEHRDHVHVDVPD